MNGSYEKTCSALSITQTGSRFSLRLCFFARAIRTPRTATEGHATGTCHGKVLRGAGQEAKVLDIPERVIAAAKWWKELMPGNGNLQSWHPVPNIVPQSAEAIAILGDQRLAAEAEYRKAECRNDSVGTTV